MSECKQCKAQFEIPKMEQDFLEKINLPHQGKCPACRMQRRFTFRNERKLYYRKCDLTGKQIVSIYSPDSPYKVYDQHEWHTDKWDAKDYGRGFDFNRPFFEQMNELMLDVPKLSLFATKNENSDFVNGAQQDKNCYMIFVSDHDEDCYYSYGIDSCKDCLECLNCYKCELCIECIDCSECYNVAYSENTHNCSDSYFLSDCKGCNNCFGCFGLRNKQYYFLNEKCSKEEYEKRLKEVDLGNHDNLQKVKKIFEKKKLEKQIRQYIDGNNNENSTGDHIINCKNCIECYDSGDLQDSGYLIFSFKSKDCFDGHVVVDNCELCYETVSTVSQYNTQFTFVSFYSKDSMYLDHSPYCQDCFGCSGLKRAKYCILNKQYSKEEYFKMRDKIIEHMKKTGEWGQPFPSWLSPFGYNETVAQEFFPLTRDEATSKGYKWHDEDKDEAVYQGPEVEIPKNIKDVADDITNKILTCEKTGKFFKLTPQELKQYRFHKLPLPRMHFEERHMNRIKHRNPRKLWGRNCMKCEKNVKTSYNPKRPEKIFCEECYLKEVH